MASFVGFTKHRPLLCPLSNKMNHFWHSVAIFNFYLGVIVNLKGPYIKFFFLESNKCPEYPLTIVEGNLSSDAFIEMQ